MSAMTDQEMPPAPGEQLSGGDDQVSKVVDLAVDQFLRENGIDLRDDPHALESLTEAARQAVIDLSTHPETTIRVPFIVVDENGTKNLRMTLTRAQLQDAPQWGPAPAAPDGNPYATPPPPDEPRYVVEPPTPYGNPYGAPPRGSEAQYGVAPRTAYGSPRWSAPARPSARGTAIASVVLGIVAMVSPLSIFAVGGFGLLIWVLTGLLGLAFGIIARVRGRSGTSLAGIIVSALAIGLWILLIIIAALTIH